MPLRDERLQAQYSRILFTVKDGTPAQKAVERAVGLPKSEFQELLGTLKQARLIVRPQPGHIAIGWERMAESYAQWMDKLVEERLQFCERHAKDMYCTYYKPLQKWITLRKFVLEDEGMRVILRRAFSNAGALAQSEYFTVNDLFRQLATEIGQYERVAEIVGEDTVLRRLSRLCTIATTEPLALSLLSDTEGENIRLPAPTIETRATRA